MIIYKGKNGLSSKEMIRVSLSSKPMKIFGFTVTTILILGVIYSTCRSVYSREHWHNINLLSNSALVGGFLSGGLHALTGSDHLAALLPLIIGKGGWHSCFYGAVWGTGHGLTSAVLGFLSYGMKNYILKWQSAGEESGDEGFLHQCGYLVDGAVGMTLIVIGMMGYYEEKSSSGSSEEVSKEEKQSMPAAGSRLEHLDTAVCSSSSGSGSRSSNHHHEYQYDDDGVIIDEEKGLKSESKVNTGRKLKSSGTERNWSWSRYWHHVEVRQCIAAGAVFMNGCMLGVSWDGLPSLAPTLVLRYPGPLLQFLFGYALATVLMMAFTAGLVGEVTQWVSHRLEASYNNNNNNNNSSSPGRGNSAESGVSDAAVFLGSGGKQQQGKNNILGSSSDFGAFARGKGGGKHPVTSNSLPTTVVPGTFRLATEAGRPGSPSSSHNNNNDDMNNDNDPFAASAATSALGSAPPPSIPVMVPKLDASGEPIIDPATGQPVLQQQVDADGSPVFQDPSGGLINAQGYQVVQQPPPAGSAPGAPPILVAQKVSSSGQPLAPQWPPPAMQPQSALQQQQQAILQQIVQQQIAQLSPQQQQEILQQQLKALPATQQQQIAQLSPQQQQLAIQQLMLQLPPEQQDQLMQLAIGQLSPQQQNQIKQTTQAVLQQQLQQQQLDLAVPNVAPLVRPKLDDKGAPIVDKNGAPLMEPVLDSAGAPIYQTQYGGMVNAQGVPIEQQIDPNTGNPMFDGTGAPVMQPVVSAAAVPVMVQQVDSKGAPLFTAQGTPVMQVVLDARGSPVYRNQYGAMINAQGVPIQQQLDESGAPMYDSRGAPVMLPQGMVGNPQQGSTMGGQADNPLSGGPDSIQGTVPDHTSHIQGPVIGGGFNTNAKRLLHGKPEGNSVHSEDVEGKGLMLKGKDGKFYYQDGPKAGKRR